MSTNLILSPFLLNLPIFSVLPLSGLCYRPYSLSLTLCTKKKKKKVSQGSFFASVTSHSLPKCNSIRSSAQSNLPKNIFYFTFRYINNTLPTRKNLSKWGLSSSPDCSFCLMPESLFHIVAGFSTYLNEGGYTWRHNSCTSVYCLDFPDHQGRIIVR